MARQEDELLTVAEAARLLRVTPHTIYRWISAGRLPAVRYSTRTIRIRPSELGLTSPPAAHDPSSVYRPTPSTTPSPDEDEEREEIKRLMEEYRMRRDRPRPADAPPRGSWEALRQTIGIISKEEGEELYRLVMEDR